MSSSQTEAMKTVMANLFPKKTQRRARGQCPFCGMDTCNMVFRDTLSKREHEISGLCQACQDKTFGTAEEEFHDDSNDQVI